MHVFLSIINRLIPKRIWQQIFLILIFLVIIPLILLGTFLIQTSQNTIKVAVLNDSKEIALHTTGEVKERIEGARQTLLVTTAILGMLKADPWRQETSIVELALRSPVFGRIASIDMEGREIAISELGTVLENRAAEEAFQQSRSGLSYISEVKIAENHMPYLTIAEPIREHGNVVGVLLADLNLRSIWEMIDGIQVGNMGRAYLIDHKGRIIAHPDKKLIFKSANLIRPEILENIRSGQAGNIEEVDSKNKKWLTSYAPIKNLNWGLVITQPESEAFAFSRTMIFQSWVIIALSVIATIFISLILARYISLPVKEIIDGTKRLSKGNFSQPFRIRGRNEIDRLLFSFNRMADRLHKAQEVEKLSFVGKAATAIAHELKNSLVLIDAFVKALPERHQDKKFIKEFAEIIPKELESWNRSLRNMMTFSRNYQFAMEQLDVNTIIEDIALLVRLQAKQRNIHFELNLQKELPLIEGSDEKLREVILHIVTNAFEATLSGGAISILTKSIKEANFTFDNYVAIEIMNTGKKIEEKDLNKIFTPFFTTKKGGLGIGLSICKEIIDYHSGKIEVSSNEGATTFSVKLPICFSQKRNIFSNELTSLNPSRDTKR